MADSFHLELFVASALHERSRFDRLWEVFGDPLVGASRWGREERTIEVFTHDPAPAQALLRGSGWLVVDGAKDGFRGVVHQQRGNLYTVDIYLAPAALDLGKRRDAWIRWMLRLIDACPVLFGHGETRPEHDAKHLIDTGESESWVGSSLAELQRFLPGVYWLTVFGSALARELPIGTLSQRAGVTVHRTGAGDAVVVLDESAKPRDLAARLATERGLAGLLGDAFFFDRERPDRDLRAVPGFVTELERAKGRT